MKKACGSKLKEREAGIAIVYSWIVFICLQIAKMFLYQK